MFGHMQREELDACRALTPAVGAIPGLWPWLENAGLSVSAERRIPPGAGSWPASDILAADDPEVFNNLGISARAAWATGAGRAKLSSGAGAGSQPGGHHYNLSALLYEQGRRREAEPPCRRALELRPNYPAALNNLANMLRERGELGEAEAVCRQALALKPDYVLAHNNLGIILHGQDRSDEAEASYRRALALVPTDLKSLNNLGNLLKSRGRLNEAADCYRAALQQAPDMAELHGNLANVQKDLGELDAALAGFSHAIRLKPAQADTWHNLLLTLQYADHARAADCAHWHRAFAEQFEAPGAAAWPPTPTAVSRNAGCAWAGCRRIFAITRSATSPLPLLQALAARPDLGLELYGYSQVLVHDPLSKQLEACCTKWRHVLGLNDDELEDCIRRDQIDILIDLSGHTANNRLPVFARKPAPVQVGWLGYPDSSGLTHIDWRITDRHGDPEGADEYYSENSGACPRCFAATGR